MNSSPRNPAQVKRDMLLFLTEDQLRNAMELLFFAYRDYTGDADRLLAERGYGRAHHRAIHFIKHRPGITVAGLIEVLGVTKQSLNRVLRQLVKDGLVIQTVGTEDRRQRLLTLSDAGDQFEEALSAEQRRRLRDAYAKTGPEAVAGFRTVLHQMMNEGTKGLLADAPGKK